MIVAGIFLALAGYAASGLYFVQPNERGVARLFGKIIAPEVPPGLHYSPRWPFGRIDLPRTTEVRRVEIGQSAEIKRLIKAGDMAAMAGSPATDVLTGDTNILKVTMVLQYQVMDPAKYVTRTADPDALVRNAAQAVMVETLARLPVDEALTIAKAELPGAVMHETAALLNRYETGISLLSAAVQSISAPEAVQDAFADVTSAKYGAATMHEQAQREADRKVALAHATAYQRIETARGNATQRLAQARGDANAFGRRLAEYQRAPQVTRDRLFLRAMEQILPKVRKFVIGSDDRGPIQLKLIEGEPGGAAGGGGQSP